MIRNAEETKPLLIKEESSEDVKTYLESLSAEEFALNIAISTNEKYKNNGIICEQEREKITEMIKSLGIIKNIGYDLKLDDLFD